MSQDSPVNPFQKALDDAAKKGAEVVAAVTKVPVPVKKAAKKAGAVVAAAVVSAKVAPKKVAPKKVAPKKVAPKKAEATPSAYEKRNNITRPGADTQTGKFWKWCDQAAANKGGAVRATLIQKAVDAGMSKFTGATQYARWRAFNA